MIHLVLPRPPSANHTWRAFRRSKAYRAWLKRARDSLWQQKPDGGWDFIGGPFCMFLAADWVETESLRPDLDNIVKPSLDFCQKETFVWNDAGLRWHLVYWLAPGTLPPDTISVTLEATPQWLTVDILKRQISSCSPLGLAEPWPTIDGRRDTSSPRAAVHVASPLSR